MTDKTPNQTAENLLNTQAVSEKETNTARDSEPKSRTLPQADALKARFKAGSIPLQTDFADLIDLANIGRLAVGGAEGQTGPADGFTLSSMGHLELKPNTDKGISVDKDGIAVKIGSGMRISSTGKIEPDITSYSFGGVEEGTEYCPVKVNSNTNGLVVDLHQGLINTDSGLSVNVKDGLQSDKTGVGVKAGNGIAITSSGVNVKLAKGANTNGGEGHGKDGATSGSNGGLNLNEKGLSVDAGSGIQIDVKGVSLKLATDSGLSADETNGLTLNEYAWIRAMCGLHNADFYAYEVGFAVFFCNFGKGCVAYLYGRSGKYVSTNKNYMSLKSVIPGKIMAITEPNSNSTATKMIAWYNTAASKGVAFKCEVKEFLNNNSSFEVTLTLSSAP